MKRHGRYQVFPRRWILRGLGGAALAVPYLRSLVERRAQAAGAAPPKQPRRLIIQFTHYGCLTNRWFPQNSHGALTAADLTGTTLEPLAPHVDKLLLPRGIRAMNQWTVDLSLGQGNDFHTQVCGSYLTCVPVDPHSSDPFDFESTTKLEAMPTAASLDHVCAEQLHPGVTPLVLSVGGRKGNIMSAISYSGPKQLFQGIGSARRALEDLTGLFGDGPISPDSYRALRGASIVDIVRDDLESLERMDMSGDDRQKLEAWKALLDETGKTVSQSCSSELLTTLGLDASTIDAYESMSSSDHVADKIGQTNLHGADLFSNIAVLSALCDAHRVILLQYPSNYVFTGLGLTSESDMMSHHRGGDLEGACANGGTEMIATIDRFYAEKFAHLVSMLDSFDEGDGTLLDNTATVWLQEFSDGAAGNLNNMPILQAGSCGGYFKTGQAINVWDGSSDLSRGNSEAPCGALDDSVDEDHPELTVMGTPRAIANAPINKYYCNLMNALGMKAGEDGFPAAGGSARVTHYGMYDDTRDFASGGANPPKINDPGGFEQLEANS